MTRGILAAILAAMHPMMYPRCLRFAPLSYGWEGYREVFVFSSQDDFETILAWYHAQPFEINEHELGEWHLELDLYEEGSRAADVLLVSTADEEAVLDLKSYISTSEFEPIHLPGSASLGAFFVWETEL